MLVGRAFGAAVSLSLIALAQDVLAGELVVQASQVVEWKAVYGQVETRDRVPARARIGGTIVELDISEGDRVASGQKLALVKDDKLEFRLDAIDARLEALEAQRETAVAELERGQALIERGVITAQRFDQLQTAVDVIRGEIRSLASERLGVEQQIAEGDILSPDDGVVLSVPVSRGSVIGPGEAVAVVAGGGVYLRLAVPERHTGDLEEGAEIEIGTGEDASEERQTGRLVKLYPQIEGGRVQADVDVAGLDGRFVGRRLPVRLPVGTRDAILVPFTAVSHIGGLDFVTVAAGEGAEQRRVVVPGGTIMRDGTSWREILTGLEAGERVVVPNE